MENKNWKFGMQQITNRTPDFAKWFFRGVLYFAAATNIVLATVVEIPEDIRLVVGKYSVYAITIVHSFSKLFGIKDYDVNAGKNFEDLP